jgi:hypothetical protein
VTDYPAVTIDTAGAEINRLHGVIEQKLRSSVEDAIRVGQILTQVKDRLPHGDFLPWLQATCDFSSDTSERYRKLYAHHSKIRSVRNLQEAYQQIETIERQQKQTEEQRAQERIREYRETGVKPDGWRRGTDDKLLEDSRQQEQRSKDMRRRAAELNEKIREEEARKAEEERRITEEREKAERERLEAESQRPSGFWINEEILAEVQVSASKRTEFKERIRISDSGSSDPFIDALMDYLEELPDDNRRIEACYNVIKVARGIAAELQRGVSA